MIAQTERERELRAINCAFPGVQDDGGVSTQRMAQHWQAFAIGTG